MQCFVKRKNVIVGWGLGFSKGGGGDYGGGEGEGMGREVGILQTSLKMLSLISRSWVGCGKWMGGGSGWLSGGLKELELRFSLGFGNVKL